MCRFLIIGRVLHRSDLCVYGSDCVFGGLDRESPGWGVRFLGRGFCRGLVALGLVGCLFLGFGS